MIISSSEIVQEEGKSYLLLLWKTSVLGVFGTVLCWDAELWRDSTRQRHRSGLTAATSPAATSPATTHYQEVSVECVWSG
ncbi:hypothetical protein O3P69_000057 [Scylla paramamosain]|uniref:Uncharacterized protein n=1 Tax=Scylla paramamosain TaxID=85552 RepID=A0AAW0UYL6_SCYPA